MLSLCDPVNLAGWLADWLFAQESVGEAGRCIL